MLRPAEVQSPSSSVSLGGIRCMFIHLHLHVKNRPCRLVKDSPAMPQPSMPLNEKVKEDPDSE